VICELSVKGRKRHKMRSFPKIKQSCRTVFTKQLTLVNLAVLSIIMIYLPKSNGKENGLKSRFCLSCKNDEMSLRPFWHNTVDVGLIFCCPQLKWTFISYSLLGETSRPKPMRHGCTLLTQRNYQPRHFTHL